MRLFIAFAAVSLVASSAGAEELHALTGGASVVQLGHIQRVIDLTPSSDRGTQVRLIVQQAQGRSPSGPGLRVAFALYVRGQECERSAAFDLGPAYRVLVAHRAAPGKYSVVIEAPMSTSEVRLLGELGRRPARRRGIDPTNRRITRTLQLDARAAIMELRRHGCTDDFAEPTIEMGVRPTMPELRRSLQRRRR